MLSHTGLLLYLSALDCPSPFLSGDTEENEDQHELWFLSSSGTPARENGALPVAANVSVSCLSLNTLVCVAQRLCRLDAHAENTASICVPATPSL